MPPIAELMEEHDVILVDAHEVRAALRSGDRGAVVERLRHLAAHLDPHVRREEVGVFAALREHPEWAEEVELLEGEHRGLDAGIAALDVLDPSFERDVLALLADLEAHVERENLGIFPVSVVTLGAPGWEVVERAHDAIPTFLPDVPRSAPPGERAHR